MRLVRCSWCGNASTNSFDELDVINGVKPGPNPGVKNAKIGKEGPWEGCRIGLEGVIYMFPPTIMLISGDAEIERAVREAARRTGISVTVARTAHEAVKEFTRGFEGLRLILVDLGPGVHGVTLFNALDDCPGGAPIVALTDCEESYMKPLAMGRGAADCLGKPITAARFQRLFEFHCAIPSN